MFKITLAAVAAVAIFAVAPSLVQAESIKAQLTPEQIATYCVQAGANTNNTTSVDLGNGKMVSGSIHCTATDLQVSSASPATADDKGSEGGGAAENGVED
jgi:hypothetical protein